MWLAAGETNETKADAMHEKQKKNKKRIDGSEVKWKERSGGVATNGRFTGWLFLIFPTICEWKGICW